MKAKMPDGTSQEISSGEIAQPCARHLRELAGQLDNLSMNFAKNGSVTGVWPGDGDLETRIGKLLDDGWLPIGFLGTKRGNAQPQSPPQTRSSMQRRGQQTKPRNTAACKLWCSTGLPKSWPKASARNQTKRQRNQRPQPLWDSLSSRMTATWRGHSVSGITATSPQLFSAGCVTASSNSPRPSSSSVMFRLTLVSTIRRSVPR